MPKFCLYCGTSLLDNARFCHNCGEVCSPQLQKCPVCASENPAHARFCAQCGNKMQASKTQIIHNRYHLDLNDLATLPMQFKTAFLNFFKMALLQDGFSAYADQTLLLFEQSGFRQQYFEEKSIEWAAEAEEWINSLGKNALWRIETALSLHFSAAYLQFCAEFAAPNLPLSLPPEVVKYEHALVNNINLAHLVADYFRGLEDNFYLHVVDIPLQRLKQAQNSFFKPLISGETPIFYLEQSPNHGILLSEYAIYWKIPFHRPASVAYKSIQTVQNFHNYLHLNDIYININPAFNFRLFKLLQKLQQVFQSE